MQLKDFRVVFLSLNYLDFLILHFCICEPVISCDKILSYLISIYLEKDEHSMKIDHMSGYKLNYFYAKLNKRELQEEGI